MNHFINFTGILNSMKKTITTFALALIVLNFEIAICQITKMPLLEEFTSSTCGPCAANNPTFDAMLANNVGNFVCIKYQMNWPGTGDIYYNSDGSSRKNNYSVSSIPELKVDGTAFGQPGGFTTSDLLLEKATPSNMIIQARYSLIDSVLTVFGNIFPQADITGNNRRYIAIVENPTHNNASSNGETEFSYVEHKMLPNGVGIYTTGLNSGAVIPFTNTIDLRTVSNIENINNLLFAVWVQNSSTREVLQSARAVLPTGIQEISNSSSGIIRLFPNPSSTETTIQFQLQDNSTIDLRLFNSLGQMIGVQHLEEKGFGTHEQIINTKNLSSGIYFVDLQIGNNHYRQPLMVQ